MLSRGDLLLSILRDHVCLPTGSIGSVPVDDSELNNIPLASRMALICGTSTCHMAVSSPAAANYYTVKSTWMDICPH